MSPGIGIFPGNTDGYLLAHSFFPDSSCLTPLISYPETAAEIGEWIPGYFKIDPITMILEFMWAATWCIVGYVLYWKHPYAETSSQFTLMNQ